MLLRLDYAKQNLGLLPFNNLKATFTLKLDGGRWVHKPRKSRTSSVSDHFSFHLVDQFVGVKPKAKPVATAPKRRRASDSGCDDSGSETDANP